MVVVICYLLEACGWLPLFSGAFRMAAIITWNLLNDFLTGTFL